MILTWKHSLTDWLLIKFTFEKKKKKVKEKPFGNSESVNFWFNCHFLHIAIANARNWLISCTGVASSYKLQSLHWTTIIVLRTNIIYPQFGFLDMQSFTTQQRFYNKYSLSKNSTRTITTTFKKSKVAKKVDMVKQVRPVWSDPFDPHPVWPVTRLTRLKMTRFDSWPVTRLTRPDSPVLPCLPMMSRLRLRCNFYKIFTYSSLLNMLCTLL